MSRDEQHRRPTSALLREALARLKAVVDDDADNTHPAQELQEAQLHLRATLDMYSEGAALLSANGVILVANRTFNDRGIGRAGERPPDPLHDIVIEPPRSEPRIVAVSMDTAKGRDTFVARIARLGDPDGTLLLMVSQD